MAEKQLSLVQHPSKTHETHLVEDDGFRIGVPKHLLNNRSVRRSLEHKRQGPFGSESINHSSEDFRCRAFVDASAARVDENGRFMH